MPRNAWIRIKKLKGRSQYGGYNEGMVGRLIQGGNNDDYYYVQFLEKQFEYAVAPHELEEVNILEAYRFAHKNKMTRVWYKDKWHVTKDVFRNSIEKMFYKAQFK